MFNEIDGVKAVEVRSQDDLVGCDGLVVPGGESTVISQLLETSELLGPIEQWCRASKPIWGTCAGMIILASGLEIIVESDNKVKQLNAIDITVERNSYGRQVDSFEARIEIIDNSNSSMFDEDKSGRRNEVSGACPEPGSRVIPGSPSNVIPAASDNVIPGSPSNVIPGSPSNVIPAKAGISSARKFEAVFIRAPKVTQVGDGVEVLAAHDDSPVLVRQNNVLACSFHPELTGDATIHELFVEMCR